MRGVARFFLGKGNDEADWAFQLAKEKALAFSVGFVPDMDKAAPLQKDDPFGTQGMEFKGQELLEVSAVTVPSNPDALQRVAKAPNLYPAVAEIVEERLAEEEPEQPAAGLSEEDIDAIAERVFERFGQAVEADDEKGGGDRRRREADDDEPSADDEEADEDDYGDGDEPEAREASPEESEFDAYAVAAAATEEALSEEE